MVWIVKPVHGDGTTSFCECSCNSPNCPGGGWECVRLCWNKTCPGYM
jgi:hypothetical protein